jgi:hypothetical protein
MAHPQQLLISRSKRLVGEILLLPLLPLLRPPCLGLTPCSQPFPGPRCMLTHRTAAAAAAAAQDCTLGCMTPNTCLRRCHHGGLFRR